MAVLEKKSKRLAKTIAGAISRLRDEVTPKSVHRLRTTVRRLESLLAHVRPKLSGSQQDALEQLFVLRKRAGRVRDLDIQMGLLGAIANGSAGADRRELLEVLRHKRQRRARKLSADAAEAKDSKLLAHIARIAEKVSESPHAAADRSPLQAAQATLAALKEQFAGSTGFNRRTLHQVRLKLKAIRYLAELAEESDAQKSFLQALKSVQDAVGEWHDWEGLAASADKLFGDRLNCPLLVEIKALLAARFSAATTSVLRLLQAHPASPARKQPARAHDSHPAVRLA